MAPAVADVYSIGVVTVATGGENANASLLAVSNSGNASTYQGIALSVTGNADGTYFAASGTGCARAPWFVVAVSGAGCAEAPVAISGAGPVGYNNPATWAGIVGVSGTNCARATHAAIGGGCAEGYGITVAGTGSANNGLLVVSGTGPAANTSNGVVVSGAGDANSSGGTAVSGAGSASGPTAFSANTTVDDGGGLVRDVTETGGVIINTGIAITETPAQTYLAATSPPDPAAVAAKLADVAANVSPAVALNMATGLLEAPLTGTSSTSTATGTIPKRHLLNFPAIAQTYRNTCVPTSVLMILTHRGMSNPGEAGLAREMKTSKQGTPLRSAAPVFDRYYTGSDPIFNAEANGAGDLMDKVTADTWTYNHGLVLAVHPQLMKEPNYWPPDSPAWHSVAAFGYDHRGGGRIVFMDPWDAYKWNSWDSSTAPNSLGAHEIALPKVYGALSHEEKPVAW